MVVWSTAVPGESPIVEAGSVLCDRYRLVRLIGEGGMGAVWAAVDTRDDTRDDPRERTVALKLLKALAAAPPRRRLRFLEEAKAAMALDHPHVVRVHALEEDEAAGPFLVMDLLAGESLASRLARGPLVAEEVARVFGQVVSAVGAAHARGIVHRDLKPDNVFLVGLVDLVKDEHAGVCAVVLDFGIAKRLVDDDGEARTGGLTETGDLLGTPRYMSPEQVYGEGDIDHRTDVWALGVMLHEAISGECPIQGANVGQIFKAITAGRISPLEVRSPSVPAPLAAMVNQMVARDRRERPSDLREVDAVLRAIAPFDAPTFGPAAIISRDRPAAAATLDQTDATSSGPSNPRSSRLPKARSRLTPVLLAAAALAIGVGGVALVRSGRSSGNGNSNSNASSTGQPTGTSTSATTSNTTATVVTPPATSAMPSASLSAAPLPIATSAATAQKQAPPRPTTTVAASVIEKPAAPPPSVEKPLIAPTAPF